MISDLIDLPGAKGDPLIQAVIDAEVRRQTAEMGENESGRLSRGENS